MDGLLADIGVSIIAATVIGVLTHKLNQPIILGYLIAGALIGPEIGLRLVTDPVSIEIISEIGLILLLFIIGLEMNLRKLIASGRQLFLAGVGQFVLCVLLGWVFFRLLNGGLIEKNMDVIYLSLSCALSSTAIVVKLLYDRFELDTLPGRITLGVLVIQDIWAILILAIQPNFSNPRFIFLAGAISKGLALLLAGFLLSKHVLRRVYEWIAKSPEMVLAVSIGWCAFIAYAADVIGLSKEMGALIAGISIASFPYSVHVTAKTLPLRDFFLTLFFISLGMKIVVPKFGMILMALGIVLFVIASRFMTVYPLLMLSGSGRRTSFISSLNLSQISEFSLVIASLGVSYGHIQKDLLALVIYAMAFTSVLSSYFIKFNHPIYLFFDRMMNRFGLKTGEGEKSEERKKESYPIVILGFHRGARSLVEIISHRSPNFLREILVIDFNPEVLKELKELGVAGLFGDISSLETLKHASIERAEIILSTIPDMLLKGTNNLKLVKACRALSPQAIIVATADHAGQLEMLKTVGANEVLLPYSMAGEHLANFLQVTFKNR